MKAISGNGCVEVFDHHQVNKVIKINLMQTVFKIGCVGTYHHEPLVEVEVDKFGVGSSHRHGFHSLARATVGGAF